MKKEKEPKQNTDNNSKNQQIEQMAEKLAQIFVMQIELEKRKRSANISKQKSKPYAKITKQIKSKAEIDY